MLELMEQDEEKKRAGVDERGQSVRDLAMLHAGAFKEVFTSQTAFVKIIR